VSGRERDAEAPTAELTRRDALRTLAALGLAGAGWPFAADAAEPERLLPWRNWSGAQSCLPAARVAPADETALIELLRGGDGAVRAVGSGHSFSPLVPTDGTLLSLANLSGMIGADAATLQSEFWGGTRMSEMGEPLRDAGLALVNMADIDYQTLAGAIATSTHGTGPQFGSYSTQVIGLRLVTATGEVLDCDAQRHPEVFRAARVSLGALGIVSRVRLQNRKAFRLHRKEWIQDTNELLEDMDRLMRENQHFEINPLLHSDVAVAMALNPTDDKETRPKQGGDSSRAHMLALLHQYGNSTPDLRAAIINFMSRHLIDFPEVVDDSYRVYANVRDVRFNEMEYSVPVEAGPACLREILALVREQNLNSYFPLEYRYVKADDIPLSMFQGRDSCSISIHQFYEMSYQDYFARVEPIFWKYEGRPHWGKLHGLNVRQLAKLYPRWQDFQDVRAALDPKGRFLNGHLRSVLGVGC
jgi:FAD-linked oxidoreductase